MENKININPSLLLRIGLSGVFIYTGISIITSPGRWIDFLPDWIETLISSQTFLTAYGTLELALGILLLLGIFLPIISFLTFLNLLVIMIFAGIGDITFRDFGLSMAALALFIISVKNKSGT